MTPHDREQEAREALLLSRKRLTSATRQESFQVFWEANNAYLAALDAYADAVEQRVRWDQQAQAEANG